MSYSRDRLRGGGQRIGFVLAALACGLLACTRSSPPDIPEFKPPPEPVVQEEAKPQVVADTSQPEAPPPEPTPEPKPEPKKEPKPVKAEPPKPEPKPEPEKKEAAAPTIVGTWRVTEMSMGGESNPMLDQMEMTLTFTEGGTVTMSMTHPQMPEGAGSQEGTYKLDGNQITLSMKGDEKTGTCTFEGNNRATLEFEEHGQKIRLVLARA